MNRPGKRLIFALLAALYFMMPAANAQDAVADSLKQLLKQVKEDTVKAKLLFDLSFKVRTTDPEEGIRYAKEGITLSEKLGWKLGIAKGYNSLGTNYKAQSDYTRALENYQRSLSLFEDAGNKKDIATLLMNIGSVYRPLHNFEKAIEYYQKALVIATEIDAKKLSGQLFGNLGVVYFQQTNYDEQLKMNEKALRIFREVNDMDNESWILSNMADAFAVKEDYKKALEYQAKAIELYDRMGNLSYKSTSLDNIGLYYFSMAQDEEHGPTKKQYLERSVQYFQQAAAILEDLDDIDYLKQEYLNMSNSQTLMGNYEGAFDNYKKYIALKDSIFSIEAKESVAKLETKRELDLRDKEIVIQQLKKRTERIYMFAGVLFLLVIIGFVTAGYRGQKRSKELISQQKHLVDEKQKEILDSINYAKRIQYALLAHSEFLTQHLPHHFVLFKPKDIVSGDFYWATQTPDHFYLAVCDSTGHGVPGAFMSLLSISFLNEAINEKRITEPDKVFNFVRKRLIDNISGDGQKDGFDGILVCLDKKNKKLSYAAANNSLVLVRDNTIKKLENDRMPVGAGEKKEDFRLFTVDLMENDLFYLYTDGFYDQFGGTGGKKLMNKNLNRMILESHQKPLTAQGELLLQGFNQWKGAHEQIDDVCLIGFKV